MIENAALPQPEARPDAAYASWRRAGERMVMRHDLNERTAGPMPSFGSMIHTTPLAANSGDAYAPGAEHAASGGKPDIAYSGEQGDAFSFGDVLDIINPLQHLPVVSMIYRKFTGDTIKPMANIIGGALFGGPIGAVSSTVNVVVKESTGRDVAENAFAMVGIDMSSGPGRTPDLDYIEPVLANATAAAGAYEKAQGGPRNFAALNKPAYSWNV